MPPTDTRHRAPHLQTVDPSAPPGGRLLHALGYPLRGAALAALLVLTAGHVVADRLPWLMGWPLSAVFWVSGYVYALECLRRTANGYANPPEVALFEGASGGAVLYLLQLAGLALVMLAQFVHPGLWLLAIALAVLLPSITMALAFGDSAVSALHPRSLARTLGGFGVAYLLPMALGMAQYFAWINAMRHGAQLGPSLGWYLLVDFLLLLEFHVMGMLMHRHHERIGLLPESDTLVLAAGGNELDNGLLARVRSLEADGDVDGAIALLGDHLRDAGAAVAMHADYRQLLRRHGRRDLLLQHAQPFIVLLLGEDEVRRALGVVRECLDLDPAFLPSDAEVVGELADAAAKAGMARLALKLARAYPNRWPREPAAPRYGLMAARMLAGPLHQQTEAGVLLGKLLRAYPGCDEREAMDSLLQSLGMATGDGRAT